MYPSDESTDFESDINEKTIIRKKPHKQVKKSSSKEEI
jgi:hypothetical protein